jgi:hypothetical protein
MLSPVGALPQQRRRRILHTLRFNTTMTPTLVNILLAATLIATVITFSFIIADMRRRHERQPLTIVMVDTDVVCDRDIKQIEDRDNVLVIRYRGRFNNLIGASQLQAICIVKTIP